MQVREAFIIFAMKHKIRNLNIQTFMFIQNCCLIMFSSYKIVFTMKTSGTNTRNHHTCGIYRQVLSKVVSILHSQSFCSLWNVRLDSIRALSNTLWETISQNQSDGLADFITLFQLFLWTLNCGLWFSVLKNWLINVSLLCNFIIFFTIFLAETWTTWFL